MVSPLVGAVNFFRDFGLFDVVLPFLLIFTIVFSILEKTRILGEEKRNNDVTYPKKTLNAVVAFVMAMLVVATNKIVTAINTALPNVVFLAVVIICFMMLIGAFYKEGEFFGADGKEGPMKKWVYGFSVVILGLIVLIFLDSIKMDSGETWLDWVLTYITNNLSGPVITSIIFLLIMIGAIYFIMKKPTEDTTPPSGNG